MFERFLKAGIAIAGVDVGESFGSPKGRKIYSALHKHLVDKRGMAEQACLLARSRGGLMLYCWAAENPDKVRCITGIYPVCNIASYPGIRRAWDPGPGPGSRVPGPWRDFWAWAQAPGPLDL